MHDTPAVRERIGDYALVRALPTTALGISDYEATHVLLPRRAHLRVLAAGDPRRLMREACILEALRHPGVPRVYECGVLPERRPWIAFELLDGPTLADALAERPIVAREALVLLRDVAEILVHAHGRGLAHGGLCPDVVVRAASRLYVTGWADASAHDSLPRSGAPDDIYALGVIVHAALATAVPPRGLRALIGRMTSLDALARPSAAEVRAEAMRCLDTPHDDAEDFEVEIDLDIAEDISREPFAAY